MYMVREYDFRLRGVEAGASEVLAINLPVAPVMRRDGTCLPTLHLTRPHFLPRFPKSLEPPSRTIDTLTQ